MIILRFSVSVVYFRVTRVFAGREIPNNSMFAELQTGYPDDDVPVASTPCGFSSATSICPVPTSVTFEMGAWTVPPNQTILG
jgi:hypothetical protein